MSGDDIYLFNRAVYDEEAPERSDDYVCTDDDDVDDADDDVDDDDVDGGGSTTTEMSKTCEPKLVIGWRWPRPGVRVYRVDIDGSIKYRIDSSGKLRFVQGGYAAIARNYMANLIAASTRVSDKGPVSILYHQLEGVKEGIDLVKKNQFITRVVLNCNSYLLNTLLCYPESRKRLKATRCKHVSSILHEIDVMRSSLSVHYFRFECSPRA